MSLESKLDYLYEARTYSFIDEMYQNGWVDCSNCDRSIEKDLSITSEYIEKEYFCCEECLEEYEDFRRRWQSR